LSALEQLPPLREVMARHDLSPKKSLGQNFLLDLNLTAKIARSAGDLTSFNVLEIGPGPGGLTRALLAAGAKKVVVIERDPRFLAALEEISDACSGRLEIIEGDGLPIDHRSLVEGPVKIVANLPYNIATPLLVQWLSTDNWPPWFQSMTLMFQKEVAQRICAQPGSKNFGRLAVLAGWRFNTEIAFDIAPSAFIPPPKVTSSIVNLIPKTDPLPCDLKKLQYITKTAFGQRRKMLRASLKGIGGDALLEKAGIDGRLRAEVLSVADFVRLAGLI